MIPIQFTISPNKKISLISQAKSALSVGCKWITLQPFGLKEKEARKIAKEIKELCRANDATFIIENDIQLVKDIDGDGVHLTSDIETYAVRQQLGEGFLIGANASNADEVVKQKQQSADYICCGYFSSKQQENCIDIEKYQQIIEQLEEKDINLPLSAYGDISIEDVLPILETGVRGITLCLDSRNVDEQSIKETLSQYLNLQ